MKNKFYSIIPFLLLLLINLTTKAQCSISVPNFSSGQNVAGGGHISYVQTFKPTCSNTLKSIVFPNIYIGADDLRGTGYSVECRIKNASGNILAIAARTDQWYPGATVKFDFSSKNVSLISGTTYQFELLAIEPAGTSTYSLYLLLRSNTASVYPDGNCIIDGTNYPNGDLYGWIVNNPSSNADLSNLTISAGTLTPPFASGTTSYTASVANSITSINVTPTASDATATITVNGTTTASGSAKNVSLNVGSNTITTVVTAQNGTTTKTYTITVTRANSTALPITLLDFRAVKNGGQILLAWETAFEFNNAYFEVERSVDGSSFSALLRITGKGNSNTLQSYTATDSRPFAGMNYYRLKQVDIDGKFSYSSIRSVNFSAEGGQLLNIYPNPAQNFVKLDFPKSFYNKRAVINIMDASAKRVKLWTVNSIQPGSLQLSVAGLPKGIYYVEIISATEKVSAKITKD